MLQESRDQPMRTTCGSGSVDGRCFTEISSLIWGQRKRRLRTDSLEADSLRGKTGEKCTDVKKTGMASVAGEMYLSCVKGQLY